MVSEGYQVQIVHSKETRSIAKGRIKSDRIDSKAIAKLLRLDALPLSYMQPENIAEFREKVRKRAFLVRRAAKLMSKIKNRHSISIYMPSNKVHSARAGDILHHPASPLSIRSFRSSNGMRLFAHKGALWLRIQAPPIALSSTKRQRTYRGASNASS